VVNVQDNEDRSVTISVNVSEVAVDKGMAVITKALELMLDRELY
jgi:hypothetical protein